MLRLIDLLLSPSALVLGLSELFQMVTNTFLLLGSEDHLLMADLGVCLLLLFFSFFLSVVVLTHDVTHFSAASHGLDLLIQLPVELAVELTLEDSKHLAHLPL